MVDAVTPVPVIAAPISIVPDVTEVTVRILPAIDPVTANVPAAMDPVTEAADDNDPLIAV